MRLSELLRHLPGHRRVGGGDPEVVGLAYDSRKTLPGHLFVCASGYPVDRHPFIPAARDAGAVGAVAQDPQALSHASDGFAVVLVEDTQAALADLAVALQGAPSRDLRLLGVTGTNGKTTTALLLERLFASAGSIAGLIGTLGARVGDEPLPSDRTTPESSDLQWLLRQMADRGASVVAMEVSSHSLELQRVRGCLFDGAVFTNLTQDHLDFHGTMEAYYAAKRRLFVEYADAAEAAGKRFVAALNADDDWGARLAGESGGQVITFGLSPSAQVRAEELDLSDSGTRFRLRSPWGDAAVRQRLIGRFNVSNSLAAAALALGLGLAPDQVAEGLAGLEGVPGRLESVGCGQPFTVVVDYAHTPDGLEQALRVAQDLRRGRVVVVFGCGGDRDSAKRPRMGAIAARLADAVYVTSDNPRTEEPISIINQIRAGIPPDTRAEVTVEPDRRRAIHQAIGSAREGDFILIAGKGHEDYQILGREKIHFDDREVAREAIHDALAG